MQSVISIRKSLLILFVCMIPTLVYAQQGRGIFFSAYGRQSPHSFGNFDSLHAFYFEIPSNETKPVYLRIFDADVGGQYDERHEKFNTRTEFTVLGGQSAGKIYGILAPAQDDSTTYAKSDVLFNHIYGEDQHADGNWITLTRLYPDKGFDTGKGYKKFVLLVNGLNGDDGNYFDLALSNSPTAKDAPTDTRSYVYDMSLVSPSLLVYRWKSFHGQIKLNTDGRQGIVIHTYDMDGVPDSLSLPFHSPIPLKPSGDGVWSAARVQIPDHKNVSVVGFNFFGADFNNTFGLYYTDDSGHPLPIYLPIKDYEPAKKPDITYESHIAKNDCRKVNLQMHINNGIDFHKVKALWVIDGDTLHGTNVETELDSTGYHPYTLLITGNLNGGLRHLEYRDSVYVNKPPNAWAGGNRVFVPGRFIAFDGTVSEDPDGRITKYLWDFGDGTTGQGARIDHIFKKAGTYKVTLHVFDNSGSPCGESSASVKVWINKPPVARISAPKLVQEGKPFWLDGTGSTDADGKIVQYEWHIGKDSVDYGARLKYVASQPGDLPVTLTVKDNAQTLNSDVEARTVIHVNYPPVAVISAVHHVVSPDVANQFSAEKSSDKDGNISKYTWNFGDGTTASGPQVNHAWTHPGNYELILHVLDNTGNATGTDSMLIHVNAPPVPDITGKLIVTRGLVKLSAAGSHDPDGKIIDYHWDFGDGSTSDRIKVEHKYKSTGKYHVTLTVTDNSNTQSAVQSISRDVIVNAPPVAQFNGPNRAAPGQTLSFDASASHDPDGRIVRYSWNFGDGHTDSGRIVHHHYAKPGSYQVQLALTDNTRLKESIAYTYGEVIVNRAPVLRYDVPPLAVPGSEIPVDLSKSYDPDGQISAYYWYENGKWVQGPAVEKIKVGDGSSQTVRVAVMDNSGQLNNRTDGSVVFRINHAPVVVTRNRIKTDNKDVMFNASGSEDPDGDSLQYAWNFGDHTHGTGAVVDHRYVQPGRYKAVLTLNDGRHLANSVQSDTITVFINSAPVVDLHFPARVAVGDSVHFSSAGTHDPDGNTLAYKWDFGDSTASLQSNPVHIFTKSGLYTVRLRVNDGESLSNSIGTKTSGIMVVGPPTAIAGTDKIVDANEPVRFDGSRSSVWENMISGYRWDFGDGSSGNGIHPIHSYRKPGEYVVTLKVVADSIGSTVQTANDQIHVKVLPVVVAGFRLPQVERTGSPVLLDPSPSVYPDHKLVSIRWIVAGRDTLNWSAGPVFSNKTGKPMRKWDYRDSISGPGSVTLSADSLPVYRLHLPEGAYAVTLSLETTSAAGPHQAEAVHYIRMVPGPVLTMTKAGSLVPGQPFNFSVSGTGLNEITNSRWNFGDGDRANGLFVLHAYQKPGWYNVQFNADDGLTGESDSFHLADSVYVNAPLNPIISAHETGMVGDTLMFSAGVSKGNSAKNITYNWDFGNGFKASGKVVRHVFAKPGNYQIKLTANDHKGAINSVRMTTGDIHIEKRPVLVLDLPDYICPGAPVKLTGAILPLPVSHALQWFINGHRVDIPDNGIYTLQKPGRYRIKAVLPYGQGDTARVEKKVIVPAPVRIQAQIPDTVIIGEANDFAIFNASGSVDPNGNPLNFTWDFGDGTSAMGSIVKHEYKRTGTYKVKLEASDPLYAGCTTASVHYQITVSNE